MKNTTEKSSNHLVKLRSGNQMIAEGALDAGCKFFAGYPITPASGIFKAMIDWLPARGGLALNSPDEISAIAYCIGASMRGYKAMTATSGPGWALMVESVQYALMTETPLVVALVQRLGPSTGGATQGAQGDVLLAEYATSGGYTIPMLCPTTARECYELTVLAFTWSELLRTPVIVLTDKEVAMTAESINYATLPRITAQDRPTNPGLNDVGEYEKEKRRGTYYFHNLQEIPVFMSVGGNRKVTVSGSAHDKMGRLQKNSPETIQVLRHLEEKIRWRLDDFAVVTMDRRPDAETLVVSYGITARAAQEAVLAARDAGEKVSMLTIHSLFPIPVRRIREALVGIRRVVIAEENLKGLYASAIRHLIGPPAELRLVTKIGSLITPHEIIEAIMD
jgi:2-oxoglutarate ferredoxin oxidoreductase subunit alpha